MPTQTIDDILNCDPTATGGGNGPDEIADGYYRLALREISMPYDRPSFGDPSVIESKIEFTFEIIGEPGYEGEVVSSSYDVCRAAWEVKADSQGPKSSKYQIWSALIGQDYATYALTNGIVKPSQLLEQECWGRIENSKPKEGRKPWPKIKEVYIELPAIAIPKKPGAARPALKKPF